MAGFTSNKVTTGPGLTETTSTSIPKSLRLVSSNLDISCNDSLSWATASLSCCTNNSSKGSSAELPLLELLVQHESDAVAHDNESLQLMSRLLETNLRDFGIEVEVVSVKPGPVVTLFEVNPAKGIKVNQINNLSKDLARTMSVTS